MVPTLVVLATLFGGSVAACVGALMVRKKTKAETNSIMANAANVLAQGAGELVTSNAARIADLERRLTIAEQSATLAHQSALQAKESELRCLARLEAMDKQIAELRHQVLAPHSTTTVTTAITTPTAGE